MNKRQFERRFAGASAFGNDNMIQYDNLVHRIEDKYFNLYCSSHEIIGDCVTDELRRYIYLRFWFDGTICFFNIPNTELLGACKYAVSKYDMYMQPASILPTYINADNKEIPLVPRKEQVVNKDVVLGYYQRNRCSVYELVHSYSVQLADIEMTINTNLQLHKMPFMITANDSQKKIQLTQTLQEILNNKVVVGVAEGELNEIQSISTAAPYIIDKLQTYKVDLENELKTYLGLNNNGQYQKASHTLEAEVESSQQDVNDMQDNVDDELAELSKRIKKTLGKDVTFKRREIPEDSQVEHMDREKMNGEAYQNENN